MTAPSPTLAALLALLDEREPIDVGPCPACVERGGGWEWAPSDGWGTRREIRPCPECSEPGPKVECEECSGGYANDDVLCFECDGSGKRPEPPQPTGRDRRTPGQALRDALGRPWITDRDGVRSRLKEAGARISVRWFTKDGEEHEATSTIYIPSNGWTFALDGFSGFFYLPGCRTAGDDERRVIAVDGCAPDPAARTALLVYADKLQARGDILGQAIALALAGECRACEGRGDLSGQLLCEAPAFSERGERAEFKLRGHRELVAEFVSWNGKAFYVTDCELTAPIDVPLAVPSEPQDPARPIETQTRLGTLAGGPLNRHTPVALDLSPPCPKCNGEGAAVGELAAELQALTMSKIPNRGELLETPEAPHFAG